MTWPTLPLGDVAETALGKMLDRGKPKGHAHVPYLRNVNVQWGRVDTSDLLTMELAAEERDRYAVEPGDLLVCEGGEIGRCAIWQGRSEYLAYQKALHRVRSSEVLEARYLRYLFEHLAQNGTLSRLGTGSTIAHLPQQQLRRVPVPLAPIDEQRRIVGILEDHLSRLDAAERSTLTAAERLKPLHRAVWRREFDLGDEEEPLLGVAKIANGQTPRGLTERLTDEPQPGSIPFYKVGDMNHADGRSMTTARSYATGEVIAALGLHVRPPGTVLIPKRGGAIATNKKRILTSEATYDLNTMGLVPSDRLVPDYLWHWLQGIDLGQLADGSNVPQINAQQIRGLSLPVPSVSEQMAKVAHLDDLESSMDRLGSQSASAARRASRLRRALLAAAFSGRLTGDSRDLEHAEEETNG